MNDDVMAPVEPEYQPIDDTSTYAQTLSNTVLALIQWPTVDPDERLFVRIQIKRLVDVQVGLGDLYIDKGDKA
jgi:hypothetical protein|tara:strand:+ start:1012 stop:1230 length:219 start_codon:yes stop_codon:yes gene_type:complete